MFVCVFVCVCMCARSYVPERVCEFCARVCVLVSSVRVCESVCFWFVFALVCVLTFLFIV